MTVLVWVLPPLVYAVVLVWLWRRFAWRIALKESENWSHRGRIDNGNVAIGIILGLLQALVWPLTLVVMQGGRTTNFYGFLARAFRAAAGTRTHGAGAADRATRARGWHPVTPRTVPIVCARAPRHIVYVPVVRRDFGISREPFWCCSFCGARVKVVA